MDDLTRQAVEWIKNRDEAWRTGEAMNRMGLNDVQLRNVDETVLKEPLKSKVMELLEVIEMLDYARPP